MADFAHWIVLGDIHDDISALAHIPELSTAKGVIVSGDMTLGGGIKQAARVLEPIAGKVPLLYAQIGNMDRGEVTEWLEEKGWNLHGRAKSLFPGIIVMGVGCSPFTPFGTPSEFPESRLAEWMQQAREEAQDLVAVNQRGVYAENMSLYERPRLVLISHTPPYGSACDRLHNGASVGSTAVRDFIQDVQPDICICGHIHESVGEEFIGKTHVLNPGTFGGGGYVVLSFSDASGKAVVTAELKNVNKLTA